MLSIGLATFETVFYAAETNSLLDDDISICQRLATEKIVDIKDMRTVLAGQGRKVRFSHAVSLVTLESGIKGVFKSVSLCEDACEVAAYKASKFLGFPLVPPTVLRTINGQKGSFQLYVNTNFDPLPRGNIASALKKADPDDVANLKLFYFVIGQWDTEAHNLLIDIQENNVKIVAIDNGCICSHKHVRYGEYPFIKVWGSSLLHTDDWEKPFPFDRAKILSKPTLQDIKDLLGSTAPDNLCKWLAGFQIIPYVLYQDSLWVSFDGHLKNQDGHPFAYTTHYPKKTIEQLKKLDLTAVKKIFSDVQGQEFLTEEFLYSILDRRDQVLAHYNSLKNRSIATENLSPVIVCESAQYRPKSNVQFTEL